jgi:hypothetical protein
MGEMLPGSSKRAGLNRKKKKIIYINDDAQYCLSPQQTGCDVICLVYDASNPRSFEYCARIYLVSLRETLPYSFLADLDSVQASDPDFG